MSEHAMPNERLMSSLYDYCVSHPDHGLVTLDGAYIIQSVSDGLLKLTGHHRHDLEGQSIHELTHPDDHAALDGAFEPGLSPRPPIRMDIRWLTAEHGELWCEVDVMLMPAHNREPHMLMVVIRDISQRKAAEHRFRDIEARREAMLEVSLDAIITMAHDGCVVDWNPAATRMFGYTELEAVGQPLANLIIPTEQRGEHLIGLARHQATGESRIGGRRVELSALHKRGHQFPVEMTMAPVTVAGQRYYTAFIHELTAWRNAHRQLQAQALQLSLIQDQLPSVFWTTDAELRLQTASGGTLATMDVDLNAYQGRTIHDILNGTEAADSGVQAHEQALTGRVGSYTLTLGGVVFEVQVRPFHDEEGAVVGTVALATDVTERHRAQLFEKLRGQVLESIARSDPLNEVLPRVFALIRQQVGRSRVHLLLAQSSGYVSVPGSEVPGPVAALLATTPDALVGRLGHQVQVITCAGPGDSACEMALHMAGVASTWLMPVLTRSNELLGTIILYRDHPGEPPAWVQDVLMQSGQLLAIALEQQRRLDAVLVSKEETLRTLGIALEHRDYETKGHTDRVVALSLALAAHLGLGATALDDLRRGAYLHDVGKIAIPDQILLKPGKPTPEEWEVIRRHPRIGVDMLRHLPTLSAATLDVVLHHHEHWNGGGYPAGLSGHDIPLLARIFAVVDTFDALTNSRPYKEAWSEEAAMQELHVMAGRVLDPAMVQAFTALRQQPQVTPDSPAYLPERQ